MTLVRAYRPQTRLDHDDLDGLLNALDREIAERGENGEADTAYYVGAEMALSIIRFHEFVDTQQDFLLLFDRMVRKAQGIED